MYRCDDTPAFCSFIPLLLYFLGVERRCRGIEVDDNIDVQRQNDEMLIVIR